MNRIRGCFRIKTDRRLLLDRAPAKSGPHITRMNGLRVAVLKLALGLSVFALTSGASPFCEASDAPRAIRFLLPPSPFSIEGDRELALIIGEYNKTHSRRPIELLQKGEGFSSLKELITFHLAGDLPEIAMIDDVELPALEPLKIARPVRAKNLPAANRPLYPFRRIVPILLADQEMLFRGHANPNQLPTHWSAFIQLLKTLSSQLKNSQEQSLVLPLQGSSGLWVFENLFEALTQRTVWNHEKLDSEVAPIISEIQSWIDTTGLIKTEENWERALQLFLDRKCPLLLGSLEMLPYLSKQATFRWTAVPLPTSKAGFSIPSSGGSLIVTRDDPAIAEFLEYLYAPPQAIRWTTRGSFLPLHPRWIQNPLWDSSTRGMENYRRLVHQVISQRGLEAGSSPASLTANWPKTAEIVRLRSEWIQALRLLFGEPTRRMPTAQVLPRIESQVKRD